MLLESIEQCLISQWFHHGTTLAFVPQPLDPFIDKKIYNKKTQKGFIMNSLIFFTYYQPF